MSNYWKNATEINAEFDTLTNKIKNDVLEIKSLRSSEESKESKLTRDEYLTIISKINAYYYPLLSNEAKFYFSLSKLKPTLQDMQEMYNYISK